MPKLIADRPLLSSLCVVAIAVFFGRRAVAQDRFVPGPANIAEYEIHLSALERGATVARAARGMDDVPNVMITGYWPPTNEMVRAFSDNLAQNPGGWVGQNWEGRGYDIYAFFPEFPDGGPNYGRGVGDFEVDYQDTSNDWWPLVAQLEPIAIITFSRAGNDHDWELEGGNRTYDPPLWTNDYLSPFDPTPGLPIVDLEPPGTERFSSLPLQPIIDAVTTCCPTLLPYATAIDPGRFLSNYIGYHGNWYHDLHADPQDPAWSLAGGHIHVGYAMSIAEAVQATEETLRVLTGHLDQIRKSPGDMNCDEVVNGLDLNLFVLALLDGPAYTEAVPGCVRINADLDDSGVVTEDDIGPFVQLLIAN